MCFRDTTPTCVQVRTLTHRPCHILRQHTWQHVTCTGLLIQYNDALYAIALLPDVSFGPPSPTRVHLFIPRKSVLPEPHDPPSVGDRTNHGRSSDALLDRDAVLLLLPRSPSLSQCFYCSFLPLPNGNKRGNQMCF